MLCTSKLIFYFHDEVHAHSVIFSSRCGWLHIRSHTLLMVVKYQDFHSCFPLRSIYKTYSKCCSLSCQMIEFDMDLTHAINLFNETFYY